MSERPLGTMVTYGYPEIELDDELSLALRIGASLLEILPEWSRLARSGIGAQAGSRSRSVDSQCPRLLGWANDSRPSCRPGIDRCVCPS